MINSSTLKEEERVAFKREQVCFVLGFCTVWRAFQSQGGIFFSLSLWAPVQCTDASCSDVEYENINMHMHIFAISNRTVDWVYWKRVLSVAIQLCRDRRIYFYWLQLPAKIP